MPDVNAIQAADRFHAMLSELFKRNPMRGHQVFVTDPNSFSSLIDTADLSLPADAALSLYHSPLVRLILGTNTGGGHDPRRPMPTTMPPEDTDLSFIDADPTRARQTLAQAAADWIRSGHVAWTVTGALVGGPIGAALQGTR